eukprot:CAMPEP_0174710934 /NCGR_PEP_ID=MMETSP1094-20130205/12399_1 /TAXON_ID=156173 /ORGANISM="Chrysochromulina brevifilum, Strain UTEX LB 985" /LENGTH=255 /DNA_ID=CAMNT_0015909799 /DNA_START=158 /DNA_END=926 /DNA_ORIENTATION=-
MSGQAPGLAPEDGTEESEGWGSAVGLDLQSEARPPAAPERSALLRLLHPLPLLYSCCSPQKHNRRAAEPVLQKRRPSPSLALTLRALIGVTDQERQLAPQQLCSSLLHSCAAHSSVAVQLGLADVWRDEPRGRAGMSAAKAGDAPNLAKPLAAAVWLRSREGCTPAPVVCLDTFGSRAPSTLSGPPVGEANEEREGEGTAAAGSMPAQIGALVHRPDAVLEDGRTYTHPVAGGDVDGIDGAPAPPMWAAALCAPS